MAYRNYGPANGFTVDSSGNGDFTTIGSALTAASSRGGSGTIFIKPGTNGIYTENPTLIAGWNLTAFTDDGLTPTVIINGKCTFNAAGTVSISGILLQTNSDNLLLVGPGNFASIVNLDNCYLNCTNNTGISFTSTSTGAKINLSNCRGNLGTTGIGMHLSSSAGVITYAYCIFTNSGASQTGDSTSAGSVAYKFSEITYPVSTSSNANFSQYQTKIDTSSTNATTLTIGGSGSSAATDCQFTSGSGSSISVSMGKTFFLGGITTINTSAANTITGLGTVNYSFIDFIGPSTGVNVSNFNGNKIGPLTFPSSGASGSPSPSVTTDTIKSYESGTWTPGIAFGGGTTGLTYSAQNGQYVKIGNTCFVSGRVTLSSKGSSTGTMTITNLPLNVSVNNDCPIPLYIYQNITLTASYTQIMMTPGVTATTGNCWQIGSGVGIASLTNSQISNTSDFSFSGYYFC